jgi:RNA recognition motif-containing protein
LLQSSFLNVFSLEAQLGTKLYVGNLSYDINKNDLEQMFAAHGAVTSAQVITDRETQRSKGFGFVEMGSDQEAQAAITALNGKSIDGRALTVNEARPQEPRSGGGGGFGGQRRGPGGGGGGGGGRGPGGGGGRSGPPGGNRY